MNHVSLILAAVVLLAGGASAQERSQAAPPAEPSPQWESLGKSAAVEFFYSPWTVVGKSGGVTAVRMRLVYRKDTPEGRAAREHMTGQTTAAFEGREVPTVAWGEITVEVNCVTRQFRNRQQSLFADGGKPIEEVPGESDPRWDRPAAGSAYELLVNAVCGDDVEPSPARLRAASPGPAA